MLKSNSVTTCENWTENLKGMTTLWECRQDSVRICINSSVEMQCDQKEL